MRIVRIFAELQQFLRLHFFFRLINSSKISSGGFLSTWRPNRKSAENLAHFVPLSELSATYLLCDIGFNLDLAQSYAYSFYLALFGFQNKRITFKVKL